MGKLIVFSKNAKFSYRIKTLFRQEPYLVIAEDNFSRLKNFLEDDSRTIFLIDVDHDRNKSLNYLYRLHKRRQPHKTLIASEKTNLLSKLDAYEAGADGFIDVNEDGQIFTSKVKALNRRLNWEVDDYIKHNLAITGALTKENNPTKIFLNPKFIVVEDQLIRLTPTEIDLVKYFIENQFRIVTGNELAEYLKINKQTLNVHLYNLKQKFSKAGFSAIITSIPSVGYRYQQVERLTT